MTTEEMLDFELIHGALLHILQQAEVALASDYDDNRDVLEDIVKTAMYAFAELDRKPERV